MNPRPILKANFMSNSWTLTAWLSLLSIAACNFLGDVETPFCWPQHVLDESGF